MQHARREHVIDRRRRTEPSRNSAEGQKSYWECFHGDVTFQLKLHASVRRRSAHGDGLCINNCGERSNMSTIAATSVRSGGMTKDERFFILASSLGTVFEWYDFYLFGSLASIIGAQFFGVIDPATNQPMFNQATRDIFALLAFAAGFIVRPFGAIVFGRVGDIVGRKYTFLVTILI